MDQIVPNGSGFTREVIATGLVRPISFAQATDGRIFVAEQAGIIKIIEDGRVTSTALDISDQVNSFRDWGLLGVTLDPNFENNGHIYLQYTVDLDPSNPDAETFNSSASGELVRYTMDSSNPGRINPASKVVILDGHQVSNATHSVGDLDFDNDGNLIFSWGDGGFDPDIVIQAQDVNSVQGKLFRIDPDTFEGVSDNPFYDNSDPDSTASKVLAYGIRNSWKFSVDRSNGDIYLGEVTDDGPEEINVVRADGSSNPNFGWPYFQGTDRTDFGTLPANFTYETPFIELDHNSTTGAGDAIFGGLFYTGDAYDPIYNGRYFFGNTSQGDFYTSDRNGNFQQFGESGLFQWTVDLQNGPEGDLIGLRLFNDNFSGGELYRLVSTNEPGNNAPRIVALASQTAGESAFDVTLDASDTVDPDGDNLTFRWDFDSDGDTDAFGPTATARFAQAGTQVTTLQVSDGNGAVVEQRLEFTVQQDSATGDNLAFGRPTIQSGTQGNALSSRAVDGNTNSNPGGGSVSQTTVNRSSLWEVDLGAVKDIGEIEIFPSSSGQPLDDFFVLISPNEFTSNNLAAARNDPGVTEIHVTEPVNGSLALPTEAQGQFVRIQLESLQGSLSLAEVRVFEEATGGGGNGQNLITDIPGTNEYLTGTTSDDIFVINSNSSNYTISNTQAGDGYTVYSDTNSDQLFGFEEIRFSDKSVDLTRPITEYLDRPGSTQHIFGSAADETFIINAPSTAYDWQATTDGGYVVYTGDQADILYNIETLRFSDVSVDLASGEVIETGDIVTDIPGVTQYLEGVGDNDIFRINGNSADYTVAPTLLGDGHVVYTGTDGDLLFGFEEVRFNDTSVILEQPTPPSTTEYTDIPNTTQYIVGTAANETFVINGPSANYGWGPTSDGGYVVYTGDQHDILYNIENLQFTDTTVELASGPTGVVGDTVEDIAGVIQYLEGVGNNDIFKINADSSLYQWGPTQDGQGVVVYTGENPDILYGFEKIQFNNEVADISGLATPTTQIFDDPNQVQYIVGTPAHETFVINDTSASRIWGPTLDNQGIVAYNDVTHDILYDVEQIAFTDGTFELDDLGPA